MKRFIVTAITALTVAALPGSAQAAVNITGISGNPGFRTGTIHYSGTGGLLANNQTSVAVGVGRIALTGTDTVTNAPVGFLAYCIDIFDYLKNGLFSIANFTFDPGKAQQLKVLLTNTAGSIDAVDASALTASQKLNQKTNVSSAIQMAVWEIAFETPGNPYSVTAGDFWMNGSGLTGTNGGISSAQSLAQGYLANINTNAWSQADPNYALKMLVPHDAANNQTQVFLVSTPVPEPATWLMLILGFGLVGGAMRKRRGLAVRYA